MRTLFHHKRKTKMKRSIYQSRRATPTRRTTRAQRAGRVSLRGTMRLSHGMVFGLALFSLCAVYVVIVNTAAVKGAEIRTLEKRIAALQKAQQEYTLQEAALRSLARGVGDDDAALERVEAQDVRVIAAVDSTLSPRDESDYANVVAVAQ